MSDTRCETCQQPATIHIRYPVAPKTPLRLLRDDEPASDEREIRIPMADGTEIVHYTTAPEYGSILKHFCELHRPNHEGSNP